MIIYYHTSDISKSLTIEDGNFTFKIFYSDQDKMVKEIKRMITAINNDENVVIRRNVKIESGYLMLSMNSGDISFIHFLKSDEVNEYLKSILNFLED